MNDDFPEALQIEVTNKCNFNCKMCIRHVWKANLKDMNITLYKKIAKSCFPKLKRLILYGFGEPFVHPQILKILRIARENLPKDGRIVLNTNGSLVTSRTASKIVKIGVDLITFSIDTVNQDKLSYLREGSNLKLITENIEGLTENKAEAQRDFELGLETIITMDTFVDIPELIRFAAEKEVNSIIASHVVPYTIEALAKTVYLTSSKQSIEILKPSLKYRLNLLHNLVLELFGRAYGVKIDTTSTELVRSLWSEAEKRGYWINLPLLLSNLTNKLATLSHLEEVFHESERTAHENQIKLKLPNLHPDAKNRKCPYIEKKTLVIRSDGKVSPCLEFAYVHPVFVNAHKKDTQEVIFGNVMEKSVKEIWLQRAYADFREIRLDMAKNFPWCGDCPYSTTGCFYTLTNDVDCYSNTPTCNECLYSVNLAQCNI